MHRNYMLATDEFFLYCAIAFFALTNPVWLTRPKKDATAVAGH